MQGRIFADGRIWQRAEFEQMARKLAALFMDHSVGEDDVIAILMRNSADYLIAMEACRYVGAFYVPLNWHGAPQELADIMVDAGAKLLIGHDDLIASIPDELLNDISVLGYRASDALAEAYKLDSAARVSRLGDDFGDIAEMEGSPKRFRGILAYTSGSTGRPKGIRREVRTEGPDRYQIFVGLGRGFLMTEPGDSFHISAPLYHSAPNALALMILAVGDVDLHIEPKFDPDRFLIAVEQHGLTHAYIVPAMMVRLLKLPKEVRCRYDHASLRYTVSTGSPCPPSVKEEMIDWFGPVLHESYGSSELGFMTLIGAEEALAKPGSVGKVLPGGSIKIVDDNMHELPAGESGTIYIFLPTMSGFSYSNSEGDLENQLFEEHATVGDMGYVDEDGYLFINDRRKDMIISGGANIFPAEIEAVLIQMPQIADCAVFGAPDAEFGEYIVAAVTCTGGDIVTLDEVNDFLAAHLAGFKRPKKLDIHDELPREESGKIFKKHLRDPYWANSGRTI